MHAAAATRMIANGTIGVLSPVCTADFLFVPVTEGFGVIVAVTLAACDTLKVTFLKLEIILAQKIYSVRLVISLHS